ncbi:MAG: Holliday junction resolvase RecU [Bacilli bacterium]|nr:Holliday junction resolvase RecU [Bacilli bacterium]MDD4608177.1 Holliday junction resolvase RecU [Bacilli bacterium]
MRYPTGIKKGQCTSINHINRGMGLEYDINQTNEYYRCHGIAVIHKKPTPITIVRVDYPSRREAVIKEAYFSTPSTTDYNGIYKGRYIDFEAKETKKEYFPLNNIHDHQVEHLKNIIKLDGIGFIIVSFTKLNKVYLLEAYKLIDFINNEKRKSIPLSYFEQEGYVVKVNYHPRLDYLKIIDDIYFKGEKL